MVPSEDTGASDADLAFAQGRAALRASQFDRAQALLEQAVRELPDNQEALHELGWAYYRDNDFARAAGVFERLGGRQAMVEKLRSFRDAAPYGLGEAETTLLPFLLVDPLPVVRIEVAGVEICALVDTGGAELILDRGFAQSHSVRLFGEDHGVFAGGARATYTHGRVEWIVLGSLEVRRVPVHVMPVRRLSALTEGRYQIDAVIGTNLLAQFLATLDYPRRRLQLQRPGARAPAGTEVPFTVGEDHFLYADGSLNGVGPLSFLVDSGLAGGAFTCPPGTLEAAGVPIPATIDRGGIGGAGPVETGDFDISALGLGPLVQQDLRGIFGAFPGSPPLDPSCAGLISHGFLRNYAWTIDFSRSLFIFN